jgi:cytochrome P450
MFVGMDPPEHTRYRRLLTGELSVRRMRELELKIAATARMLIDGMRGPSRTADLVPAFALPLPSLTICDLLGISYADAERIRPVSAAMLRTDSTAEQVKDCYRIIYEFLQEAVERKQRERADDMLSGLIESTDLSTVELTSVAFQLFTAGHETTANMLSLGTYTLLTHPEQLAEIKADPDTLPGAVEELLRYLTIIQFGVSRGATVTVSLPGANRDPDRFADPDVFDIHRQASGNLAFGFGVHQCVAQQLARAQMRIGYQTLFTDLPGLALAVPAEQVEMRTTEIVYGVNALPVTW